MRTACEGRVPTPPRLRPLLAPLRKELEVLRWALSLGHICPEEFDRCERRIAAEIAEVKKGG
jgi:hypothetical protein